MLWLHYNLSTLVNGGLTLVKMAKCPTFNWLILRQYKFRPMYLFISWRNPAVQDIAPARVMATTTEIFLSSTTLVPNYNVMNWNDVLLIFSSLGGKIILQLLRTGSALSISA
jgi:hypothetical protein